MNGFKPLLGIWYVFIFFLPASLGVLNQEQIFQEKTDEKNYNKRLRPNYQSENPLHINASLYLYGLSTVNDLQLEYSLQMLVRLRWLDERLDFQENSTEVPKIVGDDWHASQIWAPQIHIVNDRQGSSILNLNAGAVLIHIEPNGRILLSQKASFKLTCKMKYNKYPMDQQTCEVMLESSTLSDVNMKLLWAEDEPVALNDMFELPEFSLESYDLKETYVYYKRTGNFSRLSLEFHLKRQFGHYLFDIYLPSGLIVIISWISPWLDIASAPARVSLGITSMLTLVTITRASREKLPRVSYFHSLDIWNIVCTIFVFVTVVEYAVVNFIYHKDKRSRRAAFSRNSSTSFLQNYYTHVDLDPSTEERRKSAVFFVGDSPTEARPSPNTARRPSTATLESGILQNQSGCLLPITPEHIANGIDRKCRLIFPLCFLIFNAIYWSIVF